MATTSDQDVVYRCVCSWVGGNPDRVKINPATCPRCLSQRKHRCKTGDCYHCDRCDYAWVPNYEAPTYAHTCPACLFHEGERVAVRLDGTPPLVFNDRRPADLFRINNTKTLEQSKVSRVLRFMLEKGEVSASVFKQAHVDLGGTTHSTHAFDRYFKGKKGGRRNTYVPSDGSYELLERRSGAWRVGKSPGPNSVRWIGSEGDTFEERLKNWLAKLDETEIGRALMVIERELAIDPDNPVTITWFHAIMLRSNEINSSAVRMEERLASTRTNDSNAAQLS